MLVNLLCYVSLHDSCFFVEKPIKKAKNSLNKKRYVRIPYISLGLSSEINVDAFSHNTNQNRQIG